MTRDSRLVPTAIVAVLVLVTGATLAASRTFAQSFSWFVYVAANLVVFLDMIDFCLRLFFRRIGAGRDAAGTHAETSVALASREIVADRGRLHLQPYAIIVSVHNLGDDLDDFLEGLAPYRAHIWVIDDASTDDTPIRLRQAGWRCVDGGLNRKKPGALRELLEFLPREIETVMVADPDITIRTPAIAGPSHLDSIIFDFQQSGMAAMCPRIAIKEDGVLGRFQALEYDLSFDLGRNSLADFCVTSGIAIYRRGALQSVLRQHSMSVYAEDLENSLILLGGGDQVYYDGRLTIETSGPATWRRWFSQRVGWSYGLIKVYVHHFDDIRRTCRQGLFATYQYLVYLGLFSLILQPFKLISLLVVTASLLTALDALLSLRLVPAWAALDPVYFVIAYAKYCLLSVIAFMVTVPSARRAYVAPIVPLYFFYALAQVVPVSVGYANWLAIRIAKRRLYRDHYSDEAAFAPAHPVRDGLEKA